MKKYFPAILILTLSFILGVIGAIMIDSSNYIFAGGMIIFFALIALVYGCIIASDVYCNY